MEKEDWGVNRMREQEYMFNKKVRKKEKEQVREKAGLAIKIWEREERENE